MEKAGHCRFQQTGLALYLWQRLTSFGFSKLAWLYTYSKGCQSRFQQAGLTLYLWQRLTTFGFSKLAWLYTYDKGWQLSVSASWPDSILVAKADNFRFQQAGLTLNLWQRLTTFGFSKLPWFYIYAIG
jgi:hypothetical protein